MKKCLFLFFLFVPFLLAAQTSRLLNKPKVYDCFIFAHELELLEIRLHELYPVVDKFVLVEWNETHRKGEQKPLYFEQNKERFKAFQDKIIHIKLEDHIEGNDGWVRENWQRNQIMRGLKECRSDDIILISDVDEMVPACIIPQLTHELRQHGSALVVHKMYRWFLNRSTEQLWAGTGIVKYSDLAHITPQGVRNRVRQGKLGKWWYTGWHFTSMGGYEKSAEKYKNIVEGYDGFLDYAAWRNQVNDHKLVPIDQSFPKFVRENIPYLISNQMIDTEQNGTR